MRITSFIVFVLVSCNIFGQAELGIGLISIDFNDSTSLFFYSHHEDVQAVQTLQFYYDSTINGVYAHNIDKQTWLRPEALNLDYDIFLLRCKSEDKSEFEVIVNNETGKTYWVKKVGNVRFLTWEEYLKNTFSVRRFSQTIIKSELSLQIIARKYSTKGPIAST